MNITRSDSKRILYILLIAITFGVCLYRIDIVWGWILKFIGFFTPIIIGFCLAFIVQPLVNILCYRVFGFLPKKFPNKGESAAKAISLVLTFIIVLGLIFLIFSLIIPQVADAFGVIGKTLPDSIQKAITSINEWLERFNLEKYKLPIDSGSDWGDLFLQAEDYIGKAVKNGIFNDIFATAGAVLLGLVSFFMGIMFSIYFIMNKEKIDKFALRFIKAYFSYKVAKRIYHFANICSSAFHKFITGQLTEACILGFLCFIGMSIFRFPYALATSALVLVMSLIPIFGAWIGAILGGLLSLTRSPLTALLFLVFLILLQQFEGNFIYPKVVGKSVGLPGILVLAAVTIGASIGGLVGLLIAVPTCSVIYTLVKESIAYRLEKKQRIAFANSYSNGSFDSVEQSSPSPNSTQDDSSNNET